MHACSLCVRAGMCVVLIVVLLICGCFYLYINFLSRMHTCIPVVYICVWEGGGCEVDWGGIVMWVCKQEIDVQVCACVLIAVFLICV